MRWIVLSAVTCLFSSTLEAQGRRVELNDLGREVLLSASRMSPDGRTVLLVTTRTNYTDNRFERSLAVVDVASGAVRASSHPTVGTWARRSGQRTG
jgi:hypothetical protein